MDCQHTPILIANGWWPPGGGNRGRAMRAPTADVCWQSRAITDRPYNQRVRVIVLRIYYFLATTRGTVVGAVFNRPRLPINAGLGHNPTCRGGCASAITANARSWRRRQNAAPTAVVSGNRGWPPTVRDQDGRVLAVHGAQPPTVNVCRQPPAITDRPYNQRVRVIVLRIY